MHIAQISTSGGHLNKCLDCELFDPYIDDESLDFAIECVNNGILKREKDVCSHWLCNNGSCPHYRPLWEKDNNKNGL